MREIGSTFSNVFFLFRYISPLGAIALFILSFPMIVMMMVNIYWCKISCTNRKTKFGWLFSFLIFYLSFKNVHGEMIFVFEMCWATHTHTAYLWMKGKIIMKCKGKQQQQLQLVTFLSNKWWIVQKFLFITLVLILDN